jgi:hypothetical protein
MLAAAVERSDNAVVRKFRAALIPLAKTVSANALQWLAVLPGPVRHGVHANTAFALALMLEASRVLHLTKLARLIERRAIQWFGGDSAYPAGWERSAHDFLSPGLAEADLMQRIMPPERFWVWWSAFTGGAAASARSALYEVAPVPRGRDGQLAHLHGLNLSRAAMLARIAAALERDGGERARSDRRRLLRRARTLYDAGIVQVAGRDYLCTHWLPTFAWDAASSIDAALEQR